MIITAVSAHEKFFFWTTRTFLCCRLIQEWKVINVLNDLLYSHAKSISLESGLYRMSYFDQWAISNCSTIRDLKAFCSQSLPFLNALWNSETTILRSLDWFNGDEKTHGGEMSFPNCAALTQDQPTTNHQGWK